MPLFRSYPQLLFFSSFFLLLDQPPSTTTNNMDNQTTTTTIKPSPGDIDPTIGIDHAQRIAARIATMEPPPSVVYTSPFLRTAHTAHHIAQACKNIPVRIEQGLYEWLVPSLLVTPDGQRTYPRSVPETAKLLSTIDTTYTSVNALVDNDNDTGVMHPPKKGAPHFPESESALLERSAVTLERLLKNLSLSSNSSSSIAIVSHAPVDQAMAFWMEGAASTGTSTLKSWPLGGITCFSRDSTDPSSKWTLEYYGETQHHMPDEYQSGLKHWSLPCLCEGGEDLQRPSLLE
jgi:phosphohistidine phosphatase SixA